MSDTNQEKSKNLFFFRDEFNGDFEKFDSLQEALDHAKNAIVELDGEGGWPQEVLDGAFQIGIITHESVMANRRENDRNEDGEVVDSSFDYLCDVEMGELENNPLEEIRKLRAIIEEARPWVQFRQDLLPATSFMTNFQIENWLKVTLNL